VQVNNGIFLNHSSSKKLVTDLKFYSTNYPILTEKYNICEQQYKNSKSELLVTDKLLSGCNSDKESLKKVTNEFELKLKDTDQKWRKCEDDKPSKVTWFAIGGVTAMIITAVLVGFLSSK
jgi:hypothetical protein